MSPGEFREFVDWHNDEEVERSRDDQKIDDGGDECAESYCTEHQNVRKIWLTDQGGDDCHQNIVDQRVDNRAKRRTDDHADCQVDHISAHDERFETLEHRLPP
jgi:hypothetical protein